MLLMATLKANSGLGMAMAQHALERGDIVIATVRRPEDPNIVELKTQFGTEGRLHIMELDVTDKKKIEEVFEKVRNSIGRIDVVYNNAGKFTSLCLGSSPIILSH